MVRFMLGDSGLKCNMLSLFAVLKGGIFVIHQRIKPCILYPRKEKKEACSATFLPLKSACSGT